MDNVRPLSQLLLVVIGLTPIVVSVTRPSLDVTAVSTIVGGSVAALGALLAGAGAVMQGRKTRSGPDPVVAPNREIEKLRREMKKLRQDLRALSSSLGSQQRAGDSIMPSVAGEIEQSTSSADGEHGASPDTEMDQT